jgi:hypothetical protein
VEYVKGKSLHLADALSRVYISIDAHPEERVIENVNALLFLRVSDDRVKDIVKETISIVGRYSDRLTENIKPTPILIAKNQCKAFNHRIVNSRL